MQKQWFRNKNPVPNVRSPSTRITDWLWHSHYNVAYLTISGCSDARGASWVRNPKAWEPWACNIKYTKHCNVQYWIEHWPQEKSSIARTLTGGNIRISADHSGTCNCLISTGGVLLTGQMAKKTQPPFSSNTGSWVLTWLTEHKLRMESGIFLVNIIPLNWLLFLFPYSCFHPTASKQIPPMRQWCPPVCQEVCKWWIERIIRIIRTGLHKSAASLNEITVDMIKVCFFNALT